MEKVVVGIDIGLSGAVGVLDMQGGFVGVWDMPLEAMQSGKNRVNAGWLADLLREWDVACVVIEHVASMPRDGHQAAFRFGECAGVVRGVVAGLGLPVKYVTPPVWKRSCGLVGCDKDYSRTLASQKWPSAGLNLKKHHGRAEALLIAGFFLT